MLNLSFGNMTIEMNIFRIAKHQDTKSEVEEVDLIQTLTENYFKEEFMRRTKEGNQDSEAIREVEIRGKESETPTWMPILEPLGNLDSKLIFVVSLPSTPERKPLPSDLKYVFLGEGEDS